MKHNERTTENTNNDTEEKKEEKNMEYTITKNPDYNSLEITFSEKPTEEIRSALKALKFRWHSVKRVWYGYTTEEEARDAIEGKREESKPERKEDPKANKFGVKVGDLFHASWGYDQTNNDFFQVIALVGASSVRVREVSPVCEQSEAICWAAEDRVFSTNTNGNLLPPVKYSTFIKDQVNGDLKRLKSYAADGKSNPQFYLSSFADAYYCSADTIKVYESWYA